MNSEELTGRANRSFPFRLGVWGEVVCWRCVESDREVYACVCVWAGEHRGVVTITPYIDYIDLKKKEEIPLSV